MRTNQKKAQLFNVKGFISRNAKTVLHNAIDLNVVGQIDLSLISSVFDTADRFFGILTMDLAIKGMLADINLSGKVDVRDGIYDNAHNGTYISNINGTFKAAGRKLVIESLKASDERSNISHPNSGHVGSVDFIGDFEFRDIDLPIFNVELALKDLIVVHRDDMTIRATGNIKINGPGLQSKITGAVELSPALIMLEEFSSEKPLHINIPELEKRKAENMEPRNPMFLIDLELNLGKNFYVRDLDVGLISQWTGSLMAKGDLDDPYLVGEISAIKGKLSFFGKQLKLKEATISFDEDVRNKPNISLEAGRDVDDVFAYLNLSGRAPFIKFSFTSEPALPEDEVLARLLFGRELSKISAGQSAQLASIAGSLNGNNKFNFLDDIRSSLGFDIFELKENAQKASLSDSGQTSSQSLSVGKEFENVRIAIDQNIGSVGSKATVSTGLSKNVYLDLELGEKNAGSGAGVSWSYRY
jgi:translocation and assembly module TamB